MLLLLSLFVVVDVTDGSSVVADSYCFVVVVVVVIVGLVSVVIVGIVSVVIAVVVVTVGGHV